MKKILFLFLFLLLLALPLCAQTVHTFPALDTDNTFTGPDLFNLLQMKNHTVSELSALTPKRNGLTELITDGQDSKDCTVGGGSTYVLCYYKTGDSTWHPYFTGAGSLVSAEWLPPLFTTNCASPATCSDIVFTREAVTPYVVYAGPSNPTLGLPYPINFSGAAACADYTGTVSTLACPYSSPVTSGNHLVACIKLDGLAGAAISGVADTLGNTWTVTSNTNCYIAHNHGNGLDTVTFTLTGNSAVVMSMYEEVGADPVSPIDTSLTSASGSSGTQTWTVTTAQPDGYTLIYNGGGAGGLGYQVMSSTATYKQEIQTSEYGGGGTGPSFISGVGWGQLASTGSQSITTTCAALSGGTCTNTGLLLAFKPASPNIPALPNFHYLKYSYLTAGGDFPQIASGNAGQALIVNSTGTALTLGSFTSGDTITSPNSTITVGGSATNTTLDVVGAAGKILAGATPALTYTPALGVDGTSAGTLQLANGSAAFHTIIGSKASANWTFNFPPTAGTSGYILKTDGSGNTDWIATTGVGMVWPSGSAGIPNYSGSNSWGTTYNASNLIPNNFLPNGFVAATFPTVTTTRFISGTHFGGTFPIDFSGATVTCDTNQAGTITYSVIVIHAGSPTTVGTVAVNSSCAATLATTSHATQTFVADDRIAISPSGADANGINIAFVIPYTRN